MKAEDGVYRRVEVCAGAAFLLGAAAKDPCVLVGANGPYGAETGEAERRRDVGCMGIGQQARNETKV